MQAVILLNLTFIFSGPHKKFSLVLLHMLVTSIALEKCKKRMQCALNYLVQGFRPLKIKITQFPDGFCLYAINTTNLYTIASLKA